MDIIKIHSNAALLFLRIVFVLLCEYECTAFRRKNSFMTMIGFCRHIINLNKNLIAVRPLLILCPDSLQSFCFNACDMAPYYKDKK